MTAGSRSAAAAGTAAGTAVPPPVVVFADREPWEGFLQFAAALRRRGVRVERLTAADRPAVRRVNDWLQRPVFSRIRPVLQFSATGQPDPGAVLAHLPAGVRGWEAIDDVAAAVLSARGLPSRTRTPECERLLFDKLALTRYAEELGVPVPVSHAAEEHRLPPPFIVKPRLGSGGAGVAVVSDAAAAAAEARAAPGRLLAQEWIRGELLHTGGVARDGVVLQVASYRAVGSPTSPFGPSSEVVTLDDPPVLEATARLVAGLGYTGAFCLDFVRADDGRALLIDFNARIFGSWSALQAAGLDLVGAYAYAWGLSDRPPEGQLRGGLRLRVPPPDLSLTGPRPLPVVLAQHLAGVARGARVLGGRWAVSSVARLLAAAIVQAARRTGGSARGSRPGQEDQT